MIWILLLATAAILVWAVAVFNQLIRLRAMTQEAWSGVDVQLKRRSDLIPNLVDVVKGYARHEQQVLEQVTRLRSQSQQAGTLAARGAAEQALAASVRGILALAEQYPDLKANQSFLRLQQDLTVVEDEIQLSRRYYNGTVRNHNILVESFPSMIVAKAAGFTPRDFFQLEDDAARLAPKVGF